MEFQFKRQYVSLPSDIYILKSDISRLDNGDCVFGFLNVDNPSEYELINKHAFQPAIKVDNNTYDVCLIFK